MSNRPSDFPDLGRLTPDQAAAAFFQLRERDDDPLDDAVLDAWLSQDEANRSAWARVCDAYDLFADDDAADRFAHMAREARSLSPRPRARWLPYAAAASLVAIAGTTALLVSGEPRHFDRPAATGTLVASVAAGLKRFGDPDYVTGIGQTSSVGLPDGSRIGLDAESAVDVAFAGEVRMVRLVRGQAAFDVAHDASKPFRVAASGHIVTALGTSFNVREDGDTLRVFLMKGSVSIVRGDDPGKPSADDAVVLRPGQQLLAQAGTPDRIVAGDASRVLAWRQGAIVFDNEPLSRAVAEINRYSRVQLVVSDPKVAALKVSGTFKAGDGGKFANSLAVLYPVRVERVAGGRLRIVAARR